MEYELESYVVKLMAMRRRQMPSDELIVAIYSRGWSLRAIAAHLNVSHEHVRKAVKRKGIQLGKRGQSREHEHIKRMKGGDENCPQKRSMSHGGWKGGKSVGIGAEATTLEPANAK